MKIYTSRFARSVLALLFMTGMFGFMPIHSAQASTLTVVNVNDSGVGSLRRAIANVSPGDAITFETALSGQTIDLSHGWTVGDVNGGGKADLVGFGLDGVYIATAQ